MTIPSVRLRDRPPDRRAARRRTWRAARVAAAAAATPGGVVLRGKIGESFSSLPATEPADGRGRRDTQGILIVFPSHYPAPRPPARRARPPGAPPAMHPLGVPFVAHRRLSEGGHVRSAAMCRRDRGKRTDSDCVVTLESGPTCTLSAGTLCWAPPGCPFSKRLYVRIATQTRSCALSSTQVRGADDRWPTRRPQRMRWCTKRHTERAYEGGLSSCLHPCQPRRPESVLRT